MLKQMSKVLDKGEMVQCKRMWIEVMDFSGTRNQETDEKSRRGCRRHNTYLQKHPRCMGVMMKILRVTAVKTNAGGCQYTFIKLMTEMEEKILEDVFSGQKLHYLALKRIGDTGKWTREMRVHGVTVSRKNKKFSILQVLEENTYQAAGGGVVVLLVWLAVLFCSVLFLKGQFYNHTIKIY